MDMILVKSKFPNSFPYFVGTAISMCTYKINVFSINEFFTISFF